MFYFWVKWCAHTKERGHPSSTLVVSDTTVATTKSLLIMKSFMRYCMYLLQHWNSTVHLFFLQSLNPFPNVAMRAFQESNIWRKIAVSLVRRWDGRWDWRIVSASVGWDASNERDISPASFAVAAHLLDTKIRVGAHLDNVLKNVNMLSSRGVVDPFKRILKALFADRRC